MIRPPAHTALTMALAAMVLLAASCARHVSRTPGAPAGILWQSFQEARQRATLTGPGLSARASLQYDGPGRKSRVVLKLWGDLGYPLRLDMEAGIGASIAMLREDAQGWTAYFPQSGEAMVNADPRRGEHPHWGTYIFNYGRNEVRNFLISNALFWLKKYHIDGLRVDAVDLIQLHHLVNEAEWQTAMGPGGVHYLYGDVTGQGARLTQG